MTRYEQDGQVWFVSSYDYVRHNGVPCKCFDLHGDFDGFKHEDTVLLDCARLADGWVRYWVTSTNDELQACYTTVVELNERSIAGRG